MIHHDGGDGRGGACNFPYILSEKRIASRFITDSGLIKHSAEP